MAWLHRQVGGQAPKGVHRQADSEIFLQVGVGMKRRVLISEEEKQRVLERVKEVMKGDKEYKVLDKRVDTDPAKRDTDYYTVQFRYCGRFGIHQFTEEALK